MPSSIADGALGRKSVEQLIAGEFTFDISVSFGAGLTAFRKCKYFDMFGEGDWISSKDFRRQRTALCVDITLQAVRLCRDLFALTGFKIYLALPGYVHS